MAKIINNLLITLTLSLLSYSWCNYLTKINWISLCFALCLATLYLTIACSLPTKQTKVTKREEKLALYIASSKDATATIVKLLTYYCYSVEKLSENAFLVAKNNEEKVIYLNKCLEKTTTLQVIEAISYARTNNCTSLTLIATKMSPKALSVMDNCELSYKVMTLNQLLTWLDNAQLTPELPTSAPPKGLKQFALTSSRASSYAWSAIFLAFISTLSYMPIYTLIWSTVLLGLSLYSKFNHRYNVKASSHLTV